MNIRENVSLTEYSTMHLGGTTRYLIEIENVNMLASAISWANDLNLEIIMIGKGSNIIWKDEGFKGLLLVNQIKGFDIIDSGNIHKVRIAAGENWDDSVYKCVESKLSGIEALSLIPGSSGATPIQNVGAYGQEISDCLESLTVYDKNSKKHYSMSNQDCHFSYRDSIFKKNPGNLFITSITLNLTKTNMKEPFYDSLSQYLKNNKISSYDPATIREAVINIRKKKLPDPKDYYNCGSFFGNPIVSSEKFKAMSLKTLEDIPHWSVNGGFKVSAAWLLEKAGYTNYHDPKTGMSTWKNQPLVLINDFAKKTADLIEFSDQIKQKIADTFDIELIQEPLLLP